MEPVTTAALIGGAANLIGGLFGKKSSSDSTKAQEAANQANLAWAREQQTRNEELQREFATQGVRWKVSDAKAAGLHPLYAMGGSTASYSPIAVGANQQAASESNWAGDMARNMGQDLSRAVSLQRTPEEQAQAKLSTELLHAQVLKTYAERDAILSNTSGQQNVAMSYPVQGVGSIGVRDLPTVLQATNGRVLTDQVAGPRQSSGQYKVKPQEVPTHARSNPGMLPRGTPGYILSNQPDGSEILVPAQGDSRMDEISAIDFIPWLRANLAHNPNFIGDYLLGPEVNNRLRWSNIKRSIASSWRSPVQRLHDFRR